MRELPISWLGIIFRDPLSFYHVIVGAKFYALNVPLIGENLDGGYLCSEYTSGPPRYM